MKKLLIGIALFAFSASPLFSTECSVDSLKKAVTDACKLISEKKEGAFTEVEAMKVCTEDPTNYVWVNTYKEQKMVVHRAKPALKKEANLKNFKDADGNPIFDKFDACVDKHKAEKKDLEPCLASYKWTKPGTEKPVDKDSYVLLCGEKYIVGSGHYRN